MPTQLIPVQVSIDYFPRGPKVIRATDDPANDAKFRNRGNASADLLNEVFTKILNHRRSGTAITLTIDDDGYIVQDPNYIPSTFSHLAAARTAVTILHENLDKIEEAVSPKPAPQKRSRSKSSRKRRKTERE